MKQFFSLLLSLYAILSFSQCPYPSTNTLLSTQTFCVDNPNQSINVTTNTTRFVLVNVVKGFSYTFSIGNVYSTLDENINVYNATTNAPIVNASGASGASITNWVATYSGQIKIIISQGACVQTSTANVTLTIQLTAVGNTQDNLNATATDTWVGHVYNWVGTSPPPGGNTSPTTPQNTYPFQDTNYVGYYNVGSETILEGFGGKSACFPVLSNGVNRTNILTEVFAVRYRMTSTRPPGCYKISLRGDDGIRLYNDGALVFSEWKQQGPTNYNNVLVYLDGSADLIFDFYEYGGQNVADLSIQPFDTALNTVAVPANTLVCSNISPGSLDGSSFAYNGGTINPTIAFQWQVSTNNVTFTNIAGATAENYTPPAIVNAGPSNIIRYYRRIIGATSSLGSCDSPSNTITITTTPNGGAPTSTAATLITCTSFTANWSASANVTSYVLDVATTTGFTAGTFVTGYNGLNVGNVTSLNITGLTNNTTYHYRVRAVYPCGTSGNSSVRNLTTTTAFAAPVTKSATAISCGSFTANWSTLTGATAYIIDVATTSTFTAGTYISGYQGLNVGTSLYTNLTNVYNNPIYYRVRAIGACETSSNSSVITVNKVTTTWNGSVWSNGIPTIATLAIINGNYNTTTNGDIDACSLTVNTGFTAVVTANRYFNIQNNLTVNGTLNVLNNGSLVQVDDSGINTGNISYQRSTTGVALDYVYWSSPVGGVNTPGGYVYNWSPTFVNPNGGEGYWIGAANTAMQPGSGYIMRDVFSRSFIGTPNNGVVTSSIARGSDLNAGTAGPNGVMRTVTDDNWNLLGNPYPSALSINSFLMANTDLDGFVRLWTHGKSPSSAIADPFYDNFVSNYTASDYIAINGAGATSGPGTLSVIGGGQGFFVLMDAGVATSETITFNNAMRDKGYSNSQFYRSAANKNQTVGEKSRIWLDLNTPTNETTRTLVAYIDEATNSRDRMYDAITDYKSPQNLYTLIGPEAFTIQGRAAFNEEDKVPVGFKASTPGTHSISIATVDGLFENNQNIFLEDTELNVIHDLRQAPYSFYTLSGIHNNRFVLRYTVGKLSNDDVIAIENNVSVISNSGIQITSTKEIIKEVQIHNVLGQLLYKKATTNNEVLINTLQKNNTALIVKIVLESNKEIVKKIIF